jgi:hypothetical protein
LSLWRRESGKERTVEEDIICVCFIDDENEDDESYWGGKRSG